MSRIGSMRASRSPIAWWWFATAGGAAAVPLPRARGGIVLAGQPIALASPRQAMANGINLVCADRVGESVMPNLTVRENLFLNPVAAGRSPLSFLGPGRETRASL